jgi:hypothetical protein
VIASTVSGLGAPTDDGAVGHVRIDPSLPLERCYWNLAKQIWVTKPRVTYAGVDGFRQMESQGSPSAWLYISGWVGLRGVDPNDYGMTPIKIKRPDLYTALAMGFSFQEKIDIDIRWHGDSGNHSNAEVAQNWYPMTPDEAFLSPTPLNIGLEISVPELPTVYKRFSTGWQTSPQQTVTEPWWYPILYNKGANCHIGRITARYRWIGGPGAATYTPDAFTSSLPPVRDSSLGLWADASHIPRADGTPIAEWLDLSGYGHHLTQTNATKQPLLAIDTGRKVVRFDGVNDSLFCDPSKGIDAIGLNYATPVTVFIVVSQTSGGNVTQVWFSGNGGPPLLYHADNTNKVNMWAGGTDITYNRASNWPMPLTCMSVMLGGDATTNVWENKTLKTTGNAGTNGLVGLALGIRNDDQTFPAKCDVAEVLVYNRALNDTERNATVDYLNAKYNLF